MNELVEQIRQYRREKLRRWAIRQCFAGILLYFIVSKWPSAEWLIIVWAILASLSLFFIVFVTKKLESKLLSIGGSLQEGMNMAHGFDFARGGTSESEHGDAIEVDAECEVVDDENDEDDGREGKGRKNLPPSR